MNTLSIVTSCHNYGQYLGDWARSLIALTARPAMVGILQNGSTDDSAQQAEDAAELLRRAGFHVKLEHSPPVNFGRARNLAIGLTETEWVMHLDADDMLMPHALEDIAQLAPQADVVCLGYERCGDLASGPHNRRKLYRSSAGETTLSNTTPCSGVSPFRRSFWERKPYSEILTGGWDTGLWLGFAHLGARFVPTKRPCFWYRQHADSVFNTRRKSSWPAMRVGTELQSRRLGHAGVSILVPRASDRGGWRDRAWDWLARWYRAEFPDWELREGLVPPTPWNKGAAVSAALEQARGSILIIADADCVVPSQALREAVQRVEQGAPWVIPHGDVHRLTTQETERFLQRPAEGPLPRPGACVRPPYRGLAGGGLLVVPRAAFVATGGIPQSFLGWGAEDETLAVILNTLLGPAQRLEYDLTHLWHPPVDHRDRGVQINRAMLQRFRASAGSPEAMWQLIQEAKGLRPSEVLMLARSEAALRHREDVSRTIGQFEQRKLAHQRQQKPINALSQIRKGGRAMNRRPISNKMMPGPNEDKGGRQFTQEAAALARQHGLEAKDFAELPPHKVVGIGIVRRLLSLRQGVA